ncbi:ion channel domain-containing protein [Ditylenchus destructor]|nr:ion channel domain-containing protein [Ditylenchus destructor]
MALLVMFIIYIFGGAFLLASYEPDMTLFKAIYFNFVSLTSIGLGDVVPQSETYMVLTLLYIAIGLALTTIAIEIFADTLKKLHYFGRKIENVGNVVIWFGGKSITMKALVKNLGDQFNLPTTTIKTLDLDTFVDNAIKVEEGELETLRPAPIEPEDLELEEVHYADDEEEMWIPQKTPSPKDPTPEPEPDPVPTPTFTCREPTPPVEKEPETAREPTPPQPDTAREPTPDESTYEEDKRKAYSEEAWRRYQEYQKQWRKFRQTSSNATVVRRESSSTSPNVERGASISSSTGLEPFSPSSTPFLSSSPSTSKVTKPTKKRRF